eukprot:scaffold76209_cov58-Phaeocystis_antarctica.AAC.3
MGSEMRAWRRVEAAGATAARGGAHGEHVVHVCDEPGVEAQRLVERRRFLPRVERRAYGAGRGAEYRGAGGGGRSRCTRARVGAHVEHVAHVCDAGGVEAQRLVERRRVLPRVERRAYGARRGAEYREAGGGGRPRRKRRAGEGSSAVWEQGTRGAHPEHVVHGRDLGRVEAQRLVEGRRVLRSRNEGTRCERGAGREATGRWEAQRATARQAARRARSD